VADDLESVEDVDEGSLASVTEKDTNHEGSRAPSEIMPSHSVRKGNSQAKSSVFKYSYSFRGNQASMKKQHQQTEVSDSDDKSNLRSSQRDMDKLTATAPGRKRTTNLNLIPTHSSRRDSIPSSSSNLNVSDPNIDANSMVRTHSPSKSNRP
jgi:hypothetical protein